ncbi:Transcriptional regulator, GntR family domain [Pseudomonas chlororaphis]|uniref:Transcriptional regulator, GntR family domain n=1 Tax=Pseudomonas chlororaphis TaxID=587753 RepID=A0A3G7TSI6_9PSED|nr:PLP-dependent aminotransferase family protein [Pseudomonas chlororaphis]AZE49398.1 Transcriptional regulator, GntR family domain [Pseudomonas chlororaphis]
MSVKPVIDTDSIFKNALRDGPGPKYMRLAQGIEQAINNGAIGQGLKLPPHRILADKIGVTAGTVSRAYSELERMGLVMARVGDGTFVRAREQERPRDVGFRNFIEAPDECHDMSRNMHIPGMEATLLARAMAELSGDVERLQELMLYTPDMGIQRHRQAGAQWLAHGDFRSSAEQILCVNGSQHGLLTVLIAMLRAGDTLVTEHLTYPGLISVARFLGIKVLGVEMDEEGLIPASLAEICSINRVSALYCTPTIQNPTTAILSPERRKEIAQICREHNVLIIEDETHGVLMQDRPMPISMYAPERGIIISSLSKGVAAGLRAGYVHVPQALAGRHAAAIRSTCWMASPLPHEIACLWIEDGTARSLLNQQIAEIERRKQAVEKLLQGLTYRTHQYSPHFWIEVPAPWRASEIEYSLRQRNHLISIADAFSIGKGTVPQFVRASVSNASGGDQALHDGFAMLAQVLRHGVNQESPMLL